MRHSAGRWGGIDTRPVIIVSDNPCPEYRLDLLDQGPIALLSDASVLDIVKVLRGTLPPQQLYATPLTGVERATLRLIATDHGSCAIAQTRDVSEQAVKNTISALYRKLHLRTRLQAAHYYFGNWHLLLKRGWTPPPHVTVPEALRQDG
jgi:DNA-binding NarL/FixJ family response regulator